MSMKYFPSLLINIISAPNVTMVTSYPKVFT